MREKLTFYRLLVRRKNNFYKPVKFFVDPSVALTEARQHKAPFIIVQHDISMDALFQIVYGELDKDAQDGVVGSGIVIFDAQK